MKTEDWKERWEKNQTGFHSEEVNSLLLKFGETIIGEERRVLAPLCGKSLDMIWLAERCLSVYGIEVAEKAVQAFFQENKLAAVNDEGVYCSDNITLLARDFFKVEAASLPGVNAVYDRAALIALPEDTQVRYAERIAELLPAGSPMLLLTLEYDKTVRPGPPFSVSPDDVSRLYGKSFSIKALKSRDIISKEKRFRDQGLTWLMEHAFLLERGK